MRISVRVSCASATLAIVANAAVAAATAAMTVRFMSPPMLARRPLAIGSFHDLRTIGSLWARRQRRAHSRIVLGGPCAAHRCSARLQANKGATGAMATGSDSTDRSASGVASGGGGAARPGIMSAGGTDARYLDLEDYRAAARRLLPRGLFEYIDRGTEGERALADLRRCLDAITLSPQVLTGHARRDLTTTLLSGTFDMPIAIAPTALAGIVAH